MADIIDIGGGDNVGISRLAINSNFENLDTDKAEGSLVSNVDNTSDANKPVSIATQSELDDKVDDSEKAAANGIATLDASSKIPLDQIPDGLAGGLNYLGTWDASTNTPVLSDGSGSSGDYYKVSVAGSTPIDGISSWSVGDWIISSTTAWDRIAATETVTSVNGYIGDVVIAKSDVGLSAADNTSDADKPVSTDQQTALDLKGNASDVSNVDNTSDANKPISSATSNALILKADKTNVLEKNNTISYDPTADYHPATKKYVDENSSSSGVSSVNTETGDIVLDKTYVGLGNVDNTSDLLKPISTATQNALNLKTTDSTLATVAKSGSYNDLSNQPSIPPVAPVDSVAGKIGAVTLVKGDVGLGSVDNTSDASKPVSTLQQTALDGKLNLSGGTITGNLTLDQAVIHTFHQITYVDSSTEINPDFNNGNAQYIIITDDLIIGAPVNKPAAGKSATITLYIYQTAADLLASLNAIYKTSGGAGLALTGVNPSKDIVTLVVDKDGNVDLIKQGDSK